MCGPQVLALFAAPGAATTAAGAAAGAATAGAATIGSTLQTIGMVTGIVGSLATGIQANNAAKDAAAAMEQQKQTELVLASTREERSRQAFKSAFAQQRADLIAKGVELDSPTAIFLGQNAAQEMVYEAQTIRQGGQAAAAELTASQRALRAQGQGALLKGGLNAAGTFLTAAPKIWPELLA